MEQRRVSDPTTQPPERHWPPLNSPPRPPARPRVLPARPRPAGHPNTVPCPQLPPRPPGSRRRRAGRSLTVEQLEDRTMLSGTPLPLETATGAGPLAAGAADLYAITLPNDGRLLATVHAAAPGTRLSLLRNSDG